MVNSISSSGSYALQQALLAMQQQPRTGPQDLFKKVDTDASGGVSQSELTTLAQNIGSTTGQTLNVDNAAFTGYDADANGTLSGKEFMDALQSSGLFSAAGTDGTGTSSTTKDQAVAAYSATSGGDALSSLIAGLQNLLQQLQSGSDDQSTSGTSTASVGHHHGGHHGGDFFKKVDTDGSGGVSMDELSAMATDIQDKTGQTISVNKDTFAAADSDGDGQLNADELKTFMEKSGFVPPAPPGGMAMGTSSGTTQTASASSTDSTSSSSTTASQKQIDLLKIMLEQLTTLSTDANGSTPTSLVDVTA
ncbi:MAG: hypothetical protein ACYC2W_10380 [Desulfurivibrionaceae bacterium]